MFTQRPSFLGRINTFKSPDGVSNCYSCTMVMYINKPTMFTM